MCSSDLPTETPGDLLAVRRQDAEAWFGAQRTAGLAPATLRSRWIALRNLYGWLTEEEEIDANPMAKVKVAKANPEPVRVLDPADLTALLKACEGTTFLDRRDMALIRTLASTGLRLAELTSLTLDDLDAMGRRVPVLANLFPSGDRLMEDFHYAGGLPAVMQAILAHPGWAAADLSSLRFLNSGSSIVPVALIDQFHARGVPMAQVYGSTETGPFSIALAPGDALAQVGSTGRPAPGVQLKLAAADGTPVAPGAVGEIQLCAPNLMRGYHRLPAGSGFVDGWYATGDLARADADGVIRRLDRDRPIYDKPVGNLDLLLTYNTRLFRNKVRTTFQLNVSNVTESGHIQGVAVNPDGNFWQYRIIDPRQFILTATFNL